MGGNAAPIVAGHSGPDGMNEVPPSKHGRFLLKANAEVSTLKRRRWRRRRRKSRGRRGRKEDLVLMLRTCFHTWK